MTFSEKLSALLLLTASKNYELAEHLGVGKPYISRLKTGERKMPGNPGIARGMAEFFAKRCEDDYRRSALFELTSNPRLRAYVNDAVIADVLFAWLTGDAKAETTPAGRFLSSFGEFTPDGISPPNPLGKGIIPGLGGISVYYKNEGKRRALLDMVTYVNELDEPCTVHLFTDEDYDWLIEDAAFSRGINASLNMQSAGNVTFVRISPPFYGIEFALSAIERWLPGYMAGAIQQYHYPWARDELHRRTLFVVPGHIAMYSNSCYAERESAVTTLTREPGIVDACCREFDSILKRCRCTMSTFNADSPERLFSVAEDIAAVEDAGIYKSGRLSINTLPPQINERIRRRGTDFAQRMYISFERRSRARENVLREHVITDIMCLPKLESVLSGSVPIPGTQALPNGCMYYTPDEYRAHIERILWYLDDFPNYQAIFTDDPVHDNVIVYAKGGSRALLIKQSAPFTVFDVTERSMASAFWDYLRRIASENMAPGSRHATVERLKAELSRL